MAQQALGNALQVAVEKFATRVRDARDKNVSQSSNTHHHTTVSPSEHSHRQKDCLLMPERPSTAEKTSESHPQKVSSRNRSGARYLASKKKSRHGTWKLKSRSRATRNQSRSFAVRIAMIVGNLSQTQPNSPSTCPPFLAIRSPFFSLSLSFFV